MSHFVAVQRALTGGVVITLTTCSLVYGAQAKPWTRQYINSLPDAAFASVETAADGTKVRRLPHHQRNGRVDLAHVRNALSRLPQVHWVNPRHAAAARAHLAAHLRSPRRQRRDPH